MVDYLPQGTVREWGITSHSGLYGNGGLPPTGGCTGMEDYLPQGAVREWRITSHRGLSGKATPEKNLFHAGSR